MINPESICFGCDHLSINNADGLTIGCRAFPDGIPYHYGVGEKFFHNRILKEQNNDYVYKPAKNEYNTFGNKITISQSRNRYADENGKFISKEEQDRRYKERSVKRAKDYMAYKNVGVHKKGSLHQYT